MNDFLRFSLLLSVLLITALALHLLVLNALQLPLYDNKILLAYSVNYMLAVAIYGALYLLRDRMTAQLGFLYMGGSVLKFLFFFILFYPSDKLDILFVTDGSDDGSPAILEQFDGIRVAHEEARAGKIGAMNRAIRSRCDGAP